MGSSREFNHGFVCSDEQQYILYNLVSSTFYELSAKFLVDSDTAKWLLEIRIVAVCLFVCCLCLLFACLLVCLFACFLLVFCLFACLFCSWSHASSSRGRRGVVLLENGSDAGDGHEDMGREGIGGCSGCLSFSPEEREASRAGDYCSGCFSPFFPFFSWYALFCLVPLFPSC